MIMKCPEEMRAEVIKAGKVPVLVVKRKDSAKKGPGVLWIHGGGYMTGMKEMVYISRAMDLVRDLDAVVFSPGYRLSFQAPYPAAAEDCYQTLLFMKENADRFGFRSDQIMAGGESAGGGLCAAVCMMARDRKDVNIAFQMPLYPMIDDRDTDSSRRNYRLPWNTAFNHAAWRLYLSKLVGETPAYAAPARQEDYTGLPPAYTFVGDHEPFYCETLQYIENLQKTGIPAKVDVYRTGMHAFDMLLPFRKISKQAAKAFEAQFLYAREHYFAEQAREEI
jgi:acetyl esterase/lipase